MGALGGPGRPGGESCTIVTVDANALVGELHNRMPLILAPGDYDAWLGAGAGEAALPHAVAAEAMVAYPVSRLVSNARNDDPACLVRSTHPEIPQPAWPGKKTAYAGCFGTCTV